MESKVCSKCKKELEICHFEKEKATKDGFHRWCRNCVKSSDSYKKAIKKNTQKRYLSGKGLPKFMFD